LDSDGYASLMDDTGDIRNDIKVPEGELGQEIRTRFENGDALKVTVLQSLGEEAIMSYKPEQESRK